MSNNNPPLARYFEQGSEMPKCYNRLYSDFFEPDGIHSDGWIDSIDSANYCHLDDCTIHLHHPDKWREVMKKEYNEWDGVDCYVFEHKLKKDYKDRPQWINDLLFKYNIYAGDLNNVPPNVKLI